MTDYKAIKGKQVLSIASDLDNAEGEGQIWFNTTSADFKTIVKVAGVWSTGANVGTARANPEGADRSTPSAGLIFGGRTSGSAGGGDTEEYNGTAWSEQNDLNVNRWRGGGAGTQTAGFSFGGSTGPTTHVGTAETYDGSSWTEVNDLTSTTRPNTVGFGVQTAALCVAGYGVAVVEEYDGSSWTEVNDINTARGSFAGCGSATAGIVAGGEAPGGVVDSVEQWNDTAWTEVGDINTPRNQLGGAGTSSGCIAFGSDGEAETEQWDDSSWTEVADLNTSRGRSAAGGTLFSAFCAAGATPGATAGVNSTEHWDYSSTLNAGAWSSQNALNQKRANMGSGGSQTAAIVFGGNADPGSIDNAETYDGTSWTEVNDLTTARMRVRGTGTTTAAIAVGGATADTAPASVSNMELYDGTNWTESTDLPRNLGQHAVAGVQTAAIVAGGASESAYVQTVEKWDGSSWTEVGDINTGREQLASAGTSTATLIASGNTAGGSKKSETEEYDGTSWTEVGDVNTARYAIAGSGIATSALVWAGIAPPSLPTFPPGSSKETEEWDGTAWTEVANLTGSVRLATSSTPQGTAQLAMCAGGQGVPPTSTATTVCEEWTQAQNVKTITD